MAPRKTAPAGPLRVVGYVRISKDTDASSSIDKQKAAIEKRCDERGWVLLRIEEDVDVSASKRRLDRPGLTRVRTACASGEADAVVVMRLDRIARSVGDTSTLLDEGVRLVATDQDFDCTSSMGRAMIQIAQVFAELEAATISERIRGTRDHLAREHKHGGGVVAYGYRSIPHPSGKGRALEVCPEEAAHVRAAADVVLGGGSLYSAMLLLRERGSKPRRAGDWSISSVRAVLVGDAVLGRITHRGEVVRGDDGLPVTPWPAVLPVEDVERLRSLLARRSGRGSHERRRASRILSGLVVCGTCGGRMRVATSTQTNGTRVRRYACRAIPDGRSCSAPSSVSADLLDAHIADRFLEVAGPMRVRVTIERSRDAAGLAAVEEALRDLSAAIIQPGADVLSISAQIAGLQARREELAAAGPEVTVEEIETDQTFAEAWEGSDEDEASTLADRRRLVSSALRGPIRVMPGQRGRKGLDLKRLEIPWRWNENAEDYLAGQED